jgi:FdhE protein
MTRDAWLSTHPFLAPLARFLDQVDTALAGVESSAPSLPAWDDYFPDYCEGLPLLRSAGAAIDLEPAGVTACSLVAKLAAGPGDLAAAKVLAAELAQTPARRVADWLLGEADLTLTSPGLLRHLGWTALQRWLQPLVDASARWRDEERWMRRYCPTCGSLPAMVWLVGVDPGHKRFLACGCCGTRWRYRRTACPFCESESHRLGVISVQSEKGFRIDHCESCRGYLKAWQGQADPAWFLADWTSLHLDVIALDRGLKRMAPSLYDLETVLGQETQPAE